MRRKKSKLLPVIKQLRAAKVPVSAETYSAGVARAVLEAGAHVLNPDRQREFKGDLQNGRRAQRCGHHLLARPKGKNVREVGDFDFGADPIGMMRDYFSWQIEIAQRAGVKNIFLDPGLGFYYRNLQDSSVRVRHQMNIFLNTFRLRELGFPVCHALPHAFEFFQDEVRCAEPFFAVLAALGKTDLFRTHEVPRIKAVYRRR